jgi:uncharacterized membrane protein (Fun14 family)
MLGTAQGECRNTLRRIPAVEDEMQATRRRRSGMLSAALDRCKIASGYVHKGCNETAPMVNFVLPDLSTTFIVAAILPLIIGFIVGVIIKSTLKIGIAIAVLLLILISLGIITPDQVLKPLLSILKSGSSLTSYAQRVAGYLPYSSLTFIIGLAVGFWKG